MTDFQSQVAALKSPGAAKGRTHAPLPPAAFAVHGAGLESYTIQIGNTVFADSPATLTRVAPELEGLQGIRFSRAESAAGRLPPIEFSCAVPVRVLVGFFQANGAEWLKAPSLETDASAADRGGAEPLIVNGAIFDGLPPVNVHAFDYAAGRHTLEVRGTGSFVVLGVVTQDQR